MNRRRLSMIIILFFRLLLSQTKTKKTDFNTCVYISIQSGYCFSSKLNSTENVLKTKEMKQKEEEAEKKFVC